MPNPTGIQASRVLFPELTSSKQLQFLSGKNGLQKQIKIQASVLGKELSAVLWDKVRARYHVTDDDLRKRFSKKDPQTYGRDVLTGQISIQYFPRSLAKFPLKHTRQRGSAGLIRIQGGKTLKRRYIDTVSVAVRRDKGYQKIRGRKGFGGYYQKSAENKWHRLQNPKGQGTVPKFRISEGLYERLTSATWKINPSLRAESAFLFGLTISQMAQNVMQYDKSWTVAVGRTMGKIAELRRV